ncbi:N-acetyltransferase [Halobacteriales archaeon QS_8_69_73]|nr:MAG: N-acetyltransferase [Halobacteriales archaeon QS_8_69_73]
MDADTDEPPLSLRKYDRRDADAVWQLHELALRDTGTDPADVPGTGALVAMGGFVPAAAGHDDERTIEGAAELHRMRVTPSCQRRGYGRRLLRALETAAGRAGFDPMLATTARRQAAAVEFYADEGYAVAGESTEGDYELVHFEKELG